MISKGELPQPRIGDKIEKPNPISDREVLGRYLRVYHSLGVAADTLMYDLGDFDNSQIIFRVQADFMTGLPASLIDAANSRGEDADPGLVREAEFIKRMAQDALEATGYGVSNLLDYNTPDGERRNRLEVLIERVTSQDAPQVPTQ